MKLDGIKVPESTIILLKEIINKEQELKTERLQAKRNALKALGLDKTQVLGFLYYTEHVRKLIDEETFKYGYVSEERVKLVYLTHWSVSDSGTVSPNFRSVSANGTPGNGFNPWGITIVEFDEFEGTVDEARKILKDATKKVKKKNNETKSSE